MCHTRAKFMDSSQLKLRYLVPYLNIKTNKFTMVQLNLIYATYMILIYICVKLK